MAYGAVSISFDGTKSVPVDGNLNAKPTDFATKFVVAFDVVPQITDAGGTAVIYKNGGLFKTFPVTKTSSSVLVVGKTLEITHGITSFTAGDVYTVAITNGAITGLGGALGGPTGGAPTVGAPFDFTVGDYVAPSLLTAATAFTPNKGAINVAFPVPSLVIPFDEAVTKPATPGDKAVYVYKEDGTIVEIVKVSTLTTSNGLQTSTVTIPVAATAIFQENTNYYVVIDAGAFVDYNTYNNNNVFGGLSAKTTWTFSTRDFSAPAISAKSITSITGVGATLNATLAETGKYYYSVSLASATAPTASQVIAGNDPAKIVGGSTSVPTAGINVPTSFVGLANGIDYKAYIVTENSFGAQGTTVDNLVFKTTDAIAPTSIVRGTLMDANKVTNALYMVFDEQVMGSGSGTLDLRKNSDESYVKQIPSSAITSRKITQAEDDANTFGIGAVNQWVTVVDLGSLASNVAYYVVFPAGYIKDLAGNSFVGVISGSQFIVPINKTDWTFTSSDFELPTVTAAFATPTSLSSNITLTFNETVQKQMSTTTDWSEVIALEQNNSPVPFTVTSPAAAGQGTVIVIDPTPATLLSNTAYTVRLRKNAVKDISSNANAITTEKVFNLTTGDLDVLTVAYGSSEGATNATPLVANSTVKIKFNKAIKVNTTGSTWVAADETNLKPLITFTKAAADMAFTLAYDATTFTATLTPTVALVSGAADYNFTFDGTKVDDAALVAPVALSASGTITYTVKDYVAPVAALSNSGNVSSLANPTITFSEDVRLLGAGATIANGTDVTNLVTFKSGSSSGANLAFSATYTNKVITIVPNVSNPLTVGSTYYYGIGASVQDASANVTAGSFGSFTMVAPTNPPAIVATTYTVNGSAQTPVATKLVNITPSSSSVAVTVTFNDNIKETQSVITYLQVSLTDGTTTWYADVTPTSVSGNTLSVTFATTASLAAAIDAGSVCTLTLPAGIVRGSTAYAPATFAAFAGTTILFDSKDITAPVVTSANTYDSTLPTPVLSTTAVALNTKLELNIGEKVALGSGNIEIREGSATGTLVQTIAVNSTNVTLNTAGTLATVVKADLVKYNTTYFIVVPAGAFKDDISLNSNAAVNFSFVTLPNPQPIVSTYSPADNSDQLSTAGTLTLGMAFSEEVIKYDPSVGSRKQWFLIKNTGTLNTGGDVNNPNDYSGTRASFSGLLDLVAGTDEVKASNYIETSSVGISGSTVTIATGFTPVAGEKYYVLVTPGSFLDKSTGTALDSPVGGAVEYPVPGVFTGITIPTTWNFTAADQNSGTVTFTYTKRADGKVAKTSDIVINFSRPIMNGDGSAITSSQIANLFTLKKDPTGANLTKVFIGTISSDKKTVTVLNSSLVTLGEMTELANYNISLTGSAIYQNGSAITGASDNFQTSDYTVPVVTPIIAAPITDIAYNATTSQHEATVTFTCTDNSNLAAVYYTIQEGTNSTAAPASDIVKADKTAVVTGTAPAAVTYKFTGLKEKTSYVVWAVAVDAAGNESTVSKVVFVTDDKTKPVIATLPTSFDAAGKLTFIFNEAVTGAAGSVRIYNAATMTQLATLDLVADPSSTPNPKLLITSAFAGLSTADALVNYYVEIDKGLVADVPVVTGDAVNTFDGLFRTALMVTSKDATAPNLVSSTPALPATGVNTNFNIKLSFDEAVQKVTTIPVWCFCC